MNQSAPQYSNDPSSRNPWFYATKPTKGTLFLRTFLPWQAYRFLRINLAMIAMIRKSHSGGRDKQLR